MLKQHDILRIMNAAQETPWAILPSKLEEIKAVLLSRLQGRTSAEELAAFQAKIVGPSDVPRAQQVGSVAVIPVFGTIGYRMNMLTDFSGGTSTEQLKAQVQRAAADPDITALVLDFSSPGGTVGGMPELHAAIMDARASKPIVASVNAQCASAAYWIASACSEMCITPSGECGSIGVFNVHEDFSKYLETVGVKTTVIRAPQFKAEANDWEPLTPEAQAFLQQRVLDYYDMFVRDVAKGRAVSVKDVKDNYGKGRMMMAQQAKAAGMVDRVETMDATLARLTKKAGVSGARSMRSELMRSDLALAEANLQNKSA